MTQAGLWGIAAAGAVLAVAAGAAEWGRGRRRDLDRPGVMPWQLMSLFGLASAIVAVAIALKT